MKTNTNNTTKIIVKASWWKAPSYYEITEEGLETAQTLVAVWSKYHNINWIANELAELLSKYPYSGTSFYGKANQLYVQDKESAYLDWTRFGLEKGCKHGMDPVLTNIKEK